MLKKIVEKHKQEKERAEKLLRAINKDGASQRNKEIKAKLNEHGELDIEVDMDQSLSKRDADPMYADRVFQIE